MFLQSVGLYLFPFTDCGCSCSSSCRKKKLIYKILLKYFYKACKLLSIISFKIFYIFISDFENEHCEEKCSCAKNSCKLRFPVENEFSHFMKMFNHRQSSTAEKSSEIQPETLEERNIIKTLESLFN